MNNEHLIAGEFAFRVCTKVKPLRMSIGIKHILLRILENCTKEELMDIILNGSFTENPTGVSELKLEPIQTSFVVDKQA